MKKLFIFLSMLILCIGSMWAQSAVTVGDKVTDASNIVSGKPYLIKYTSMTGTPYIYDAGISTPLQAPSSQNTAIMNCVFYFISDGNGAYKLENAYTGNYWPAPTGNQKLYPTTAANAGSWAISISSGTATMTCTNGETTYGLDRLTPDVVGWSSRKTVEIYEVSATDLSTTSTYSEFLGKDISVSSTAASNLVENQWYVMSQRSRTTYVFENTSDHKLKHTQTKPSGSAVDKAGYLFRLLKAADGKYYLQNGYGNYMGAIEGSTNVPTTALGEEAVTIAKIATTEGHFYAQGTTNGVVLDANDFTSGDPATVVGWGTSAPTSTGGNNDWAFYPVDFVESWNPAINEVYTINNTNTSRGALIYNPDASTKYVWSSGKSGTFDASNANSQWVIIPSGTDRQYYLYNVGADKFAIPSNTNSTSSWVFSSNAVAITFIMQNDGTYKIKTATTDTYAAISNGYAGPVINYNDIGGNFTITKVNGDQSEAANAAVAKLVDNVTPLSDVPSAGTSDWYIIRIKTHGTYADKYIYPAASEIEYGETKYPLTFEHGMNVRPAIDEATYYTRIIKEGNVVYWQMPNGKYLYGSNNKFPISTDTKSSFNMDYTNGSGFRMWGSSRYAVPYLLSSKYFIGETASTGNAYYDIYPINLTTAGLTAWTVSIEESDGTETLTCNHANVSGLSTVYNNGYIFLPTGTTPAASDFTSTVSYGYQVRIDGTAKTIKVVNIDKIFDNLKNTGKFDILEGSTVMGPSEFDAPAKINAAIDAANALVDPNTDTKIAFIESENGTMIQNYLDQVSSHAFVGENLANIQFTMNKEYGTLILPCPCTRIEGLDIYSCSGRENNTLTLTPVVDGDYVQNVPYIIHAKAGSKYTIIGWDKGSTATHTVGWLTGVLNSETYIPDGSYMLATNKTTKVQAFYKVTGSGVKCAINKCYLTVPSNNARTLYLDIDGEITAIEEVFGDETEQGAIYNLAGQRLTKAQKGINIINGKKVIK